MGVHSSIHEKEKHRQPIPITMNSIFHKAFHALSYRISGNNSPVRHFHSEEYLRHTARRLEHLASLGIPVSGMSVLEVGAGIGDHSHYYIDRGCQVTITETRQENLDHLASRYPNADVLKLDLDAPQPLENSPFEVVHCYGTLYHLKNPELALTYLGQACKQMLFLETCVSFGEDEQINPVKEMQSKPSQAYSGIGCRPTRQWIYSRLQKDFDYVYIPLTQPNHEEFPLDWNQPQQHKGLSRSIFIASKSRIENKLLTTELLQQQIRHA
jgi:hypothetical protein